MTVGTTLNVAQLLTDGAATDFPYAFIVFEKEDLQVVLRDLDGVVVKTYAQNEFSISGLGANAGSINIVPAPVTAHEVLIMREVPVLQPTDIVNQGGFFPEVIERQFDEIVMQNQQADEKLSRAIVADLGDPAYTLGRLDADDVIQFRGGKLEGLSLAEFAAPANAAAAVGEGYAAALITYTFGYIGLDATVPAGVDEGEGFVYTVAGRVYGALNLGGSADVKFEILTKALAEAGGAGSGTVTSVALGGGSTGLTFSAAITTSGTITVGGTLAIAHGGTGSDTAEDARTELSAAASGANVDITSLKENTTITAGGTIAATSLGFRGVPPSAQAVGSAITLGLTDSGRVVVNTLGGWTIPANSSIAFPIGTAIILYNDSASTQTVAITTDTLRRAGTTDTGTRTVALRGMASLMKVKTTEWLITGNIT